MSSKKPNTVEKVTGIIAPVADEMNLTLWHVAFEKEGASWFLRIFIDKPGGVTIDDCERFSRRIDKLLDEADPIEQSYFLEVSSPGIERELVTEKHLEMYIGQKVTVNLLRPIDKQKDFTGILKSLANGEITLETDGGETLRFPRSQASHIKVFYDFQSSL